MSTGICQGAAHIAVHCPTHTAAQVALWALFTLPAAIGLGFELRRRRRDRQEDTAAGD